MHLGLGEVSNLIGNEIFRELASIKIFKDLNNEGFVSY